MHFGIVLRHCCVALAALSTLGCTVPIAMDLGEHEANQALVALERAGVYAHKEPDAAHEGR